MLALRVPPAAAIDMNAVAPDLDLPGFKITPFVTERAEYESNVFQTPSHAKDDLIIKTIPGIVLELPLGAHRLDLGVRAEFLHFMDMDKQDATHVFLLGKLVEFNLTKFIFQTPARQETEDYITGRFG